MTFAETTDWTLLRSLLLAGVGTPFAAMLEQRLRSSPRRALAFWLLMSPFLFPELLLGYLLAPTVATMSWRAEAAGDVVLLLRGLPVGVAALLAAPPAALSAAAFHVRRMKLQSLRDYRELGWCYLHGPVRRVLPAFGLMFLITFQEFEAAALLNTTSWTDRLFVEHATGLAWTDSLRLLVRPVLWQLVVLAGVAWGICSERGSPDEDHANREPKSALPAEMFSVFWFLLGVALPLCLLPREMAEGWSWLGQQPGAVRNLLREITTAGLVSLVAGLGAWTLALFLESARCPRMITAAVLLPGLCGGLTVSLLMHSLAMQVPGRWLSQTPLMWVVALVIWLLPRAVLLRWWLSRWTEPAASHLVALLGRSPDARQAAQGYAWWWRGQVEPQAAAVGLLCYWGYLDLTCAALHAPPGLSSVVVRLYNFMHFGHSAAMTMEAVVVMGLPLLLGGGLFLLSRLAVISPWGRHLWRPRPGDADD